jgi:hypothetical protein
MRSLALISALNCALLMLLCGCAEPQFELPEKPETVMANLDLKVAVINLIRSGHRAGSVVYRSECEGRRSFREVYQVRPMIEVPPLDEGLTRLSRAYPSIHWSDFGGPVRVQDATADATLLNLRLAAEFEIRGKNPDDASRRLWAAPEVQTFAKDHQLELGTRIGEFELKDGSIFLSKLMPPDDTYAKVQVRLKNATVGAILDRIAKEYRFSPTPDDPGRIWYYEECKDGEGMRVAFGVL